MPTELKFKSAEVRALYEHAKSAKEHGQYNGVTGPGLVLQHVTDHGIYLMSNGLPGHPWASYAHGFSHLKNRRFGDKARAALGDKPFALQLPLDMFEPWLKYAAIGVLVSPERVAVRGLFEGLEDE